MRILNNTNCNIHIGGQTIGKYCSKDVDIDKSDKKLKFLLSTNSITILNTTSELPKKVDKEVNSNTIKNISDKPARKKNETGNRKENITLGDEKIDA